MTAGTSETRFTADFQVKMVALLFRDSRASRAVLTYLRPELFGAVYQGRYLSEIVGWLQFYRKEYPAERTLPRYVFDQWAYQWTEAQPEKQRDYHRQAWARLGWEIYDSEIAGLEEVRRSMMDWVMERERQALLLSAKKYLERAGNFDGFDLFGRVRSIEALPASAEDLGLGLGFDPVSEFNQVLQTEPRIVLPLGRPEIDDVNSGGFGRKELWVVAAPPNVGKTTTLASFGADFLRQGMFVSYVTLEHDAGQVRNKVLTNLAGEDIATLKANPDRLWYHAQQVQASGGRLLVQEYAMNRCTISQLEGYMHSLAATYGRYPDAVLLDYADNMDVGRDKTELRHALSRLYMELRGLAQELEICLITATQTNRSSVSSKVIHIDQLAEAFDKAAIADGIIALCQTDEEQEQGLLRLFWAKNRHGNKYVTVPTHVTPILSRVTPQSRAEVANPMGASVQLSLPQHFQMMDMSLYGAPSV